MILFNHVHKNANKNKIIYGVTKMKTFKLDGIIGQIDQHGFIFWGGIGCHLSGLTDDCALKVAALKAK